MKSRLRKKAMNKKDTCDFLKVLANVFVYASALAEKVGYESIADKLEDDFASIYYAEQELRMELGN